MKSFFSCKIALPTINQSNQRMQTRSGKTYVNQNHGKYHVSTNEMLDNKMTKVIMEFKNTNKIYKIIKMYRIVNDNFEDKMAVWNGGKHYYSGLNRALFCKSVEFQKVIQELLVKVPPPPEKKKRQWNYAINQLKMYQTKYKKHQAELVQQIQDWIRGGPPAAPAPAPAPVGLGIRDIGLKDIGLRDRIDLNIVSTVLEYLY